MARRTLDPALYQEIVAAANSGTKMKSLIEQFGLTVGVLGPILVASGIRQSKDEVKAFETKRVQTWMDRFREAHAEAGPEPQVTVADLVAQTQAQLRQLAKDKGLRGYSRMSKDALVKALSA